MTININLNLNMVYKKYNSPNINNADEVKRSIKLLFCFNRVTVDLRALLEQILDLFKLKVIVECTRIRISFNDLTAVLFYLFLST